MEIIKVSSLMIYLDKLMILSFVAVDLNQAIKSIAFEICYIIPTGKELICIPSFHDLMVDDKRITALRLVIELR